MPFSQTGYRSKARLFGLLQLTTLWLFLIACAVLLVGLAAGSFLHERLGFRRADLVSWSDSILASREGSPDAGTDIERDLSEARKRSSLLQRKLDSLVPQSPYVVIDAIGNRLYVKEGDRLLRESRCSTGSRTELFGPNGRRWFFDTPRGVFHVLSRHDNPIWIKPDWAFVEENQQREKDGLSPLPIPPARSKERLEEGMLGAHSLNFGNGYMIHGTLYTLKLGQPVTHGCIRLGDDDLEFVYGATKVGTSIYIY